MRCKILSTALLFLAPLMASGAWVDDDASHCQIQVRSSVPGELFHWSGDCVAGKAEGQGVLTSSHGAFLKGEYKGGSPMEAYGRWSIPRLYGGGPLVPWYLTYKKGEAIIQQMNLPGVHQRLEITSINALAGRWKLTSDDGSCVEFYDVGRSGTQVTHSGNERLESAVAVLKVEERPSTLAVLETTVRSDGGLDCSSRATPLDRTILNYVELVDENKIRLCGTTEPIRCSATAVRTTP